MKLSPFAFLFPSAHRHLSMTFTGRTTAAGFLPRRAESAGDDIAVKSDPLSRKHRDRGHLCGQIISKHTDFFFPVTMQHGINNSVRNSLAKGTY